MPRKTKAELAAELEEQNPETALTEGDLTEDAGDETEAEPGNTLSNENADILAESETDAVEQENAIADLLASYSETVEADGVSEQGGQENEPEIANENPSDDPEDAPVPEDGVEADDPMLSESEEPLAPDRPETETAKEEEDAAPAKAESAERRETADTASRPPRRNSFFQTNFRELDRDLSPEQMQEWNNIYASYRSKSILTGIVIGVDDNRFDVRNPQTGLVERRTVRSLVIVDYRIKVLIPESEVWVPGEERPDYVMRGMVGAKIDYVVMQVDREGDCAIASRRSALAKQRRHFMAVRGGHEAGEILECNLLVVGPRRVLAECGGYDISLSQRDLSWTAISDLRREYRPGQELSCKLKEYSAREGKLSISVRDVNPNPFEGAENRHPIGSRRQATISGKYAGGVFCRLSDDVTILCLYSNMLGDDGFYPGDNVLVHITQYDYNRQLIYGRIISKW